MAVDAGECEPVSGANSLIYREDTGKSPDNWLPGEARSSASTLLSVPTGVVP